MEKCVCNLPLVGFHVGYTRSSLLDIFSYFDLETKDEGRCVECCFLPVRMIDAEAMEARVGLARQNPIILVM